MTLACVIPGPQTEMRRVADKDRWCFKCRKRLPHSLVLLGDPPPDDPAAFDEWLGSAAAYYEPIWVRRCSGCNGDHTRMG